MHCNVWYVSDLITAPADADTPTSHACSIDSYHFNCMTGAARKEFSDSLKQAHADAYYAENPLPVYGPEDMVLNEETGELEPPNVPIPQPPPRIKVEYDSRKTFTLNKCWSCRKVGGRRCFVCGISGRKVESCESVRVLFRLRPRR